MKDPRDIIWEPIVSEKSYELIEASNTYTFLVDPRTNKTEIKEAVKTIFDVKVLSVNTANRLGKVKGSFQFKGKRPDVKRAYVTLAEGDTIDIFGV